jgi:hypothetical protein
LPSALVAVALNVYAVPAVKPVMVHDNNAVVQVCPVLAVAVNEVTAVPPSLSGELQLTSAEELDADAALIRIGALETVGVATISGSCVRDTLTVPLVTTLPSNVTCPESIAYTFIPRSSPELVMLRLSGLFVTGVEPSGAIHEMMKLSK